MKNEYEYDLSSDLTIVGLLQLIIVVLFLYCSSLYTEHKLKEKLVQAQRLVINIHNENNITYNIIDDLNQKLKQKDLELKEYNDLKQLKEDVRTFWERR